MGPRRGINGLDPVARADLRLLRALRTRGHHPLFELTVLGYSRLGEHSYLWLGLAAAGFALQPDHRAQHVRAVRVLVATEVANAVLKRVLRRPRPRMDGLPQLMATQSLLSYPSAHAATSFAAAGALSGALPAAPLHCAAVAMALSRPYLGVHYPSDILAGAMLGTAPAELVP